VQLISDRPPPPDIAVPDENHDHLLIQPPPDAELQALKAKVLVGFVGWAVKLAALLVLVSVVGTVPISAPVAALLVYLWLARK
jgi:hypothetical protein